MNATPVFFDSTILIDHLNRGEPATSLIAHYDGRAISAIVWMEVLTGDLDTPKEKMVRQLLATFHKVEISFTIQERAARIRKYKRLKLPDAIIYATAEEYGARLITRNDKDFDASDTRIQIPYRL